MPVACQSREVTEPQRDLSAELTEGLRPCVKRKDGGLCPPIAGSFDFRLVMLICCLQTTDNSHAQRLANPQIPYNLRAFSVVMRPASSGVRSRSSASFFATSGT